jgi:hypothetical protein
LLSRTNREQWIKTSVKARATKTRGRNFYWTLPIYAPGQFELLQLKASIQALQKLCPHVKVTGSEKTFWQRGQVNVCCNSCNDVRISTVPLLASSSTAAADNIGCSPDDDEEELMVLMVIMMLGDERDDDG